VIGPAIPVAVIVGGAVKRRPPVVVAPTPIGMAVPHEGRAKTESETPSIPRVIAHGKAIGIRAVVIVPPIPWVIIETRAIDYCRPVHIGAVIPGGVPHIDHCGGSLINIDVFGVKLRVVCRNTVYLRRPLIGHRPGPIGG
jgi:hypothetical protein